MSELIAKLNRSLSLQIDNIMCDNPNVEELKAIAEQTKQLTSVAKQITDNHRLILDAAKFNHSIRDSTDISDIFDVSDSMRIHHG